MIPHIVTSAEEHEACGIACRLTADTESDGNYNGCEHRQKRKNGFGSAAVFGDGNVCDPRVERGIVRGRAEECHDAVHDDNDADRCGDDLGGIGDIEELSDILARDECEHGDGEAPDYVAAADEDFAAVELVAESTHDECGHNCGYRRRGDHLCYIVGCAADVVEQECVEVDVLNSPRDLPDEAEQDDVEENPPSKLFLFQLYVLRSGADYSAPIYFTEYNTKFMADNQHIFVYLCQIDLFSENFIFEIQGLRHPHRAGLSVIRDDKKCRQN